MIVLDTSALIPKLSEEFREPSDEFLAELAIDSQIARTNG